jgi:hypothetical protein
MHSSESHGRGDGKLDGLRQSAHRLVAYPSTSRAGGFGLAGITGKVLIFDQA